MFDLSFQPLVWSGYVLDGQRRGPLKVRVRSVAGGDVSRTYPMEVSYGWRAVAVMAPIIVVGPYE